MKTKHSLYIVTIHDTEHAVRATSKRVATQFAIDNRISTRMAGTDDIIRIVRSGASIIGDAYQPDKAVTDNMTASEHGNDLHLPHAYVKE